jgi:aerobic carbon-monoxide dehydrogenase medium subunit
MFPADFCYVRAGSLPEALDLLTAVGDDEEEDVKLLAGGQSLLPMMKLRLATPQTLIDIAGLPELTGVAADADGRTVIGALTTYRELQRDQGVAAKFPAMADALAVLADQQVRARGTIGGGVAHGDPAADLPAVLLALDAEVTLAAPGGTRATPLDSFLQGIFATDLAPDEIITRITVPAPAGWSGAAGNGGRMGSAYEKFEQPASHLPLAGVCAVVRLEDGVITSARVAVTGVAGRPFRALDTERSLASAQPSDAAIEAAASVVASGVRPLSDQHASGPFRLHLAEILTRRALRRAVERVVAT